MKLHRLTHISLLIVAISLFLQGCGRTTSDYLTPVNAGKAAYVACTGIALFVPESEQAHVCDYIWSIAHGIRTFEGGRVPTPQEMQAMIAQFTPNGVAWANVGTSIGMIWAGAYPLISGDPKLALEYLEAIAANCEMFAANCRTPSP